MPFSFSPGDIIYLEEVPYTDHPKYHLVLSVSDDMFFIINSNINKTVAVNTQFLNCQVKLSKNPHNSYMPKEESYIACHQLAPDLFSGDIEAKIKAGKGEIKGKLDKSTLEQVINTVINHGAHTLSPYERRIIEENLKSVLS
ncbi:MAG TPA: hypothetical protein PLZ15_14145 [Melioribacteraceae bacterium]|nr:hypothetical protein [Melioribacteraceae bacterium]